MITLAKLISVENNWAQTKVTTAYIGFDGVKQHRI
jgi:hypothetical protein